MSRLLRRIGAIREKQRKTDDQIVSQGLVPKNVNYRVGTNREIFYRDPRTGSLVYLQPGTGRQYDQAASKLTPAERQKLEMQIEQNLQNLAIQGRQQGMSEFGRELPQSDDDFDPLAESITDLGVSQNRDDERREARQIQNRRNAEANRLLQQLKVAEEDLEKSRSAQQQFEQGNVQTNVLRERLALPQRQLEVNRLEKELSDVRSGLSLEEYTLDPSRAKLTLNQYIDDLVSEEEKTQKEINLIEESIRDPRVAERNFSDLLEIGLLARMSPNLIPSIFSDEKDRFELKRNLYSELSNKQRTLSGLADQRREYQRQLAALPETMPLTDAEKEQISGLGEFEMRPSTAEQTLDDLIEQGKEQAMASFANRLPESDPEDFGESIDDDALFSSESMRRPTPTGVPTGTTFPASSGSTVTPLRTIAPLGEVVDESQMPPAQIAAQNRMMQQADAPDYFVDGPYNPTAEERARDDAAIFGSKATDAPDYFGQYFGPGVNQDQVPRMTDEQMRIEESEIRSQPGPGVTDQQRKQVFLGAVQNIIETGQTNPRQALEELPSMARFFDVPPDRVEKIRKIIDPMDQYSDPPQSSDMMAESPMQDDDMLLSSSLGPTIKGEDYSFPPEIVESSPSPDTGIAAVPVMEEPKDTGIRSTIGSPGRRF